MSTARYHVGDALAVVRDMPERSVDCVVTSWPYLNLRSYLAGDDPAKGLEMGQEDSPGEFIEAGLTLMDELWRVLADHGTYWLVLGDTHAGSGGAGGDYAPDGLRAGQQRFDGTDTKARRRQAAYRNPAVDGGALRDRAVDEALGIRPARRRTRTTPPGWPLDQSVCWVPHLVGASLAYGRNLLTGAPHRQWVTRPPVTWCKRNPVVGRLTRTFRTGTELVIYGGKHQGHYFDLDAVRVDPTLGYELDGRVTPVIRDVPGQARRSTSKVRDGRRVNANSHGVPPLNWWVVNTVPYKAAHFAVFPPELVVRPIEAGCPRRVCVTCGQPSQRVVESESFANGKPRTENLNGRSAAEPWRDPNADRKATGATFSRVATTVGWSTCGCPGTDGLRPDGYHTGTGWRPGVVLDTHAGTGTTLAVATGHGRTAIGIDLDHRNAELAQRRLGMFLHVTDTATGGGPDREHSA